MPKMSVDISAKGQREANDELVHLVSLKISDEESGDDILRVQGSTEYWR